MQADENSLAEELEFFESQRDELLGRAEGEFALVKNRRLVDVFKSRDDAIRRGFQEFGNVPFLVKEILRVDPVANFTNILIAA